MKVAVIGAGTAGICAAKHSLAHGCSVTVYEQAERVGGTWVYTDNIGSDSYGLDVHSSMYKGLHTNLPKEIMGFPDFPIPKQEKSYISAEDMLAFLNLYSLQFNVKENIKFQHYVVRVRPRGESQWEVMLSHPATLTKLMFVRGKKLMYYANDFDDEFLECDFIMAKSMHLKRPSSRTENKGISSDIKKGIVDKLTVLMPPNRRHFWQNL